MPPITLKLGARGSLLSRMQSTWVAHQLEAAHPGLSVELSIITTSGDTIQNRPLHEFGGKGLFTKELEQALLKKEVDFAVHSFKDVPVTMPLVDTSDLVIAATPPREDPRDLFACKIAKNILDLPKNAKVGTGSLRRQAQLLALRPDLQILPIRGNIDTRLRKLSEGQYDAVILATAGIKRANLFDPSFMVPIPTDQMLPAAGQAALALQCHRDRADVRNLLRALHHEPTFVEVSMEREIVRALDGDCHSPIAALAIHEGEKITLRANVAARGGHPPLLRAQASTPKSTSADLLSIVMNALNEQGAKQHLHPPNP